MHNFKDLVYFCLQFLFNVAILNQNCEDLPILYKKSLILNAGNEETFTQSRMPPLQ